MHWDHRQDRPAVTWICTELSHVTGLATQDLRSLFWTVNKEEEKNLTLESVANSDYAYTRFEFMEALVRTAFARYIHGGVVTDGSDATKMLMQHLRGEQVAR